MSLVMNTAIGTWNGGKTAIDGKHWPAQFFIDYVRVWQKEINVCCSPPDFPTKTYIEKNKADFGEWVTPTGYETCPEIYPKSAYDNAEALKARAASIKLISASKLSAAAFGATGKAQVLAAMPYGHVATKSYLVPLALVLAAAAAAGFVWRRATVEAFTSSLTEPLADGEPSGEYELAR